MPGEGPSELPLHYGGKVADGELIKRPTSPSLPPTSPVRAYHQPRIAYSPERTPIDQPFSSEDLRGGLRRRPSNQAPLRRHSGGEYDRERPSLSQDGGSRRPLRYRDDGYYRDEERGPRRDEYHPDTYERSRPPRTYRNLDAWERTPGSASKPYFEESRMERDLEGGWAHQDKKRISDEESIDGYNYDAHRRPGLNFKSLSPEEKAEVMRLPWTQWMNSDFKNRKCPPYNSPDSSS